MEEQQQVEDFPAFAPRGQWGRMYCMPLDTLGRLLAGGAVTSGIPDGAQVVAVTVSQKTGTVVVKVQHPSFPRYEEHRENVCYPVARIEVV